jgi:hypothetical protein
MRNRHCLVALQASVFCCLLLCSSNAISQSPIEVSSFAAPVNQLSMADLDFLNSTTPKWLFTISMQTHPGDTTLTVMMTIRLKIILSGGEQYDDAAVIRTKEPHFTVHGSRTITNLDLNRTIPVEKAQIRADAKRRLEETALPGGSVPAGRYEFSVEVTPVGGTPATTGFSIVTTNPTGVELISPIDGDQFATPFPTFQWRYDGPSSRISIYEKLPGQITLEEAASGISHYSAASTSNSLQYPSSGARLLEPGKTYVWSVEGLSSVTGGTTVALKSALRSFTVASNEAQSISSILDELARVLPQYQSLFDEIKAQGFTTAATLRINGSMISVLDLQRLLNKLRLNPDAVTSVELE